MGRCGSLWVVVGHCGLLWVVVDRCGSFRDLVTTVPCKPRWFCRKLHPRQLVISTGRPSNPVSFLPQRTQFDLP